MPVQPKIGVALGSGGARGFAHIGVLEVLEEHKIPIAAVAGSSMGALLGAIYATGAPIAMMQRLALHLPISQWVDFTVPHMGFVLGARVHRMIRLLTKDRSFEEAMIPLAVVATDLELGERVVFTSGPIHEAVRASIAIPGIFVPHRVGGRILVDGGVIDRVPITAARDLGCDIVVAVDVGLFDRLPPVKNVIDVIVQSIDIMEREVFRHRILDADLVVRPELDLMSSTSFAGIDRAILAGRVAMQTMMPDLLALLKQKGVLFHEPDDACQQG